jgi:lysophospholipase L1-like esterase
LTLVSGGRTVGVVRKEVTLGVPGLALVAAGGLWAQAQRAARAPLPHFADLDPSGRYGTDPRDGSDPLRIVVLGDSTLTGPGLFHGSQVWIARIADRLGRPVTLQSHARGGARARDVLRHQSAPATARAADLFVVSVGANDAVHGSTARRYLRDLSELLDSLSVQAPVVSTGLGDMAMIPRIPATLRPLLTRRCRAIDDAHAEACERRADVHRIPVAELSDPQFRAAGPSVFAGDLFHPNVDGHALWAELFEPWIHRALQHLRHPVAG